MKRIDCLFVALLAMFSCQVSTGQRYVTTEADKAVAAKVMEGMAPKADLPLPDLMMVAAKSLMGTEYVAGTLEEDPSNEQLRLYLTKTDCILFVETCLNLARAVKAGGGRVPSFDDYAALVAGTRYRCEPPFTYGDRIHYTTEWIRRQEVVLKDVTLELGGEVNDHPIFFMTKNSRLYKQLADADINPGAALDLEKVAGAEESLNREPMTYIPKDRVASVAGGIRSGDIICFVSKVEGLDIAHVALAYVERGRVGFIHASQADGKVEIDKRTIAEYVGSRSNLSGIKVVRPL